MTLKDKYYTITEAAKVANVTRQTISRWVAERRFPVEKIGRTKFIRKNVFDEFERSRFELRFGGFFGREMMNAIRRRYKLTEQDLVYPFPQQPKNTDAYHFVINWENGTEDMVQIELGEIDTRDLEDGGLVKVEIKKFSKSPFRPVHKKRGMSS